MIVNGVSGFSFAPSFLPLRTARMELNGIAALQLIEDAGSVRSETMDTQPDNMQTLFEQLWLDGD
jgi:hypothetical protein